MNRGITLERAYLIAVGAAGGVLFAWSVLDAGVRSPVLYAWFAVTGFAVEAGRARARRDISVSLINVVIFTAVIVGGAPLAVVAGAAGGTAVGIWTSDRRVVRALFNAGQWAIAAWCTGLAYAFFIEPGPGSFPAILTPEGVLVLVSASILFTLVNSLLVVGILHLASAEPFRSTLQAFVRSFLLIQVLHVGLSVIAAAVLLEISGAALIFLLVPALVARAGQLGFQEQAEAYDRLVRAFVKAIEVKDGYTSGHAERVAQLAEEVASELGLGYDDRLLARYGALLHDVGKIGIPLAIINKRGTLDDHEFDLIKQHPIIGAEILRDIDFLAPAVEVVRYHHERVDGCGYPYGVSGDDLPYLARLVTVVDAFDAMTSTRSYRRALEVDVALAEMKRCAGTQFEPGVVVALERVVRRLDWQPSTEGSGPDPSCLGDTHARMVIQEARA